MSTTLIEMVTVGVVSSSLQIERTTVAILLDFDVTTDFPKKVSLDGFTLRRIPERYREQLIERLGEILSKEDRERWRKSRYMLVNKRRILRSEVWSENPDVQLFNRFSQLLRIFRSTGAICHSVAYDGKLNGSSRVVNYRSNPRRLYPITQQPLTRADARRMRRYHQIYEGAAIRSDGGYDRIATALFFFEYLFHDASGRHKIVNVVTALEALFNTSSGESTYKIAVRCAIFLDKKLTSRLEIFNSLKEIYKFRSMVTHGQALPKKVYASSQSGVALISLAEEYTRRCLRTIIEDDLVDTFSQKQDDLERELDFLVLGG